VVAPGWSKRVRHAGRDPEAGVGVEEQPESGLGSNRVRQERLARQCSGELEVWVIISGMTARDDHPCSGVCLHPPHQIVLRMQAAPTVSKAVTRLREEDP
jgi:hypothetical protein